MRQRGAVPGALVVLIATAAPCGGARASAPRVDPPASLSTGWEVKLGDGPQGASGWKAAVPPVARTSPVSWFRVTLPRGRWPEPTVYLPSVAGNFEVLLGGERLYEDSRGGPRGYPVGARWHLVRLPDAFAGQELLIRAHSDVTAELGPERDAWVGSRSTLIERLVTGDLDRVVVALFGLFVGAISLVLFALRPTERAYLGYGLLATLGGLSTLALTGLKQLLVDDARLWQHVLSAARVGSPPALLYFVLETVGGSVRWLRWTVIAAAVLGASMFAGLWLDFEAAYAVVWPLMNVQFLAGMGVAIVVATIALRRGRREAWPLLVAGLVWLGAGILEALVVTQDLPLGQRWVPWAQVLFLALLGAVVLERYLQVFADLTAHAEHLATQSDALSRAELDLRSALQTRDDFLSVAAHELRGPVTALQLQLELLETKQVPTGAGPLAAIRRQADRLGELARRLTDVSSLRRGSMSFFSGPVELCGLVFKVLERHREDAARAGCELQLHVPARVQGVWDPARLGEVLSHLLSNALKFGAGRPVQVRVEQHDPVARVCITDHGVGISPENQARIFDRFERAGAAYPGLGLGLWFSREIVRELGGRVYVLSEPGRGASFVVELPLPSPARWAARAAS